MKVFNSQICTTREQSERLLALGLKKETADCGIYYSELAGCDRMFAKIETEFEADEIPAWSLHRLIEMIKDAIVNKDGNDDNLMLDISEIGLYDGTIDAIAELIKEGYFNKEYLV